MICTTYWGVCMCVCGEYMCEGLVESEVLRRRFREVGLVGLGDQGRSHVIKNG